MSAGRVVALRLCLLAVVGTSFFTAMNAAPSAYASNTAVARAQPVLGSESFAGTNGIGWGTYKPREIFNGGDPSGMIQAISWSTWGKAQTYGFGNAFIFRAPPLGGYYPHAVRVELLASDLGRCTPRGPLAYQRLQVREPTRPGGKLGPWFAWSGAKTLCRFGF
jgi:hypothetical protein